MQRLAVLVAFLSLVSLVHTQQLPLSRTYAVHTIATPSSLQPPGGSTISLLHGNAPQEEDASLPDDGVYKHIDEGGEVTDQLLEARQHYIYETAAARIFSHRAPRKGDHLDYSIPSREEGDAFLNDGGRRSVSSRDKPTSNKRPAYIHESIAASILHSERPRASLLHDDVVMHVRRGVMSKGELQGSTRAFSPSPFGKARRGGELGDGAAQGRYSFLVDDGGKHVEGSISSTEGQGTHLQGNAPQGTFAFLHNDGSAMRRTEQSYGAERASTSSKASFSSDEDNLLLHGNTPQGEYSFLLDNGGTHAKLYAGTPSKDLKKGQSLSDDDAMQERHSLFLVDSGGKHAHGSAESASRASTRGDNVQLLHDNAPQEEYSFLLSDGAAKEQDPNQANKDDDEQILKMEVDGSDSRVSNYMQSGDEVQLEKETPSNEDESLRMVVGDSANHLRQSGMRQSRRGRSSSCTRDPNVCQRMVAADAGQILDHIVLYGSQYIPGQQVTMQQKQPACCNGKCVDLNTDDMNCGMCNHQCGIGDTCCNGTCTNLNKDDRNCGQCGHACPAFHPCEFGMCGYY